jgi:hypothetical protein
MKGIWLWRDTRPTTQFPERKHEKNKTLETPQIKRGKRKASIYSLSKRGLDD